MDYELLLKNYYEYLMPIGYSNRIPFHKVNQKIKENIKRTHGFNVYVAKCRIAWYQLFGLDKLCMN